MNLFVIRSLWFYCRGSYVGDHMCEHYEGNEILEFDHNDYRLFLKYKVDKDWTIEIYRSRLCASRSRLPLSCCIIEHLRVAFHKIPRSKLTFSQKTRFPRSHLVRNAANLLGDEKPLTETTPSASITFDLMV